MSERLKYWTDNDDHEPLIFDDRYLLNPTDIVAELNELTAENKDLKQRNEALENVDERAADYRDLVLAQIKKLDDDGDVLEAEELQKELEEIKNA